MHLVLDMMLTLRVGSSHVGPLVSADGWSIPSKIRAVTPARLECRFQPLRGPDWDNQGYPLDDRCCDCGMEHRPTPLAGSLSENDLRLIN
jgi:hypothetical protein